MTTIPIQQTSIISSYSTNLTKQTSSVAYSEIASNVASSETNSQQTETLSLSDIAEKYDVENMSAEEMKQLSQELYDNNHISLLTYTLLYGSAQDKLDADFEGILAQTTGAVNSCNYNSLQEWENQLQTDIKAGLSQDEMAETKKVVSLLQNLKALS